MGFTALHFAAYKGDPFDLQQLTLEGTFNHIRIVKLLLDNGADPTIRSKRDDQWNLKARTPLDAAKQENRSHIIKTLQERGITE